MIIYLRLHSFKRHAWSSFSYLNGGKVKLSSVVLLILPKLLLMYFLKTWIKILFSTELKHIHFWLILNIHWCYTSTHMVQTHRLDALWILIGFILVLIFTKAVSLVWTQRTICSSSVSWLDGQQIVVHLATVLALNWNMPRQTLRTVKSVFSFKPRSFDKMF